MKCAPDCIKSLLLWKYERHADVSFSCWWRTEFQVYFTNEIKLYGGVEMEQTNKCAIHTSWSNSLVNLNAMIKNGWPLKIVSCINEHFLLPTCYRSQMRKVYFPHEMSKTKTNRRINGVDNTNCIQSNPIHPIHNHQPIVTLNNTLKLVAHV